MPGCGSRASIVRFGLAPTSFCLKTNLSIGGGSDFITGSSDDRAGGEAFGALCASPEAESCFAPGRWRSNTIPSFVSHRFAPLPLTRNFTRGSNCPRFSMNTGDCWCSFSLAVRRVKSDDDDVEGLRCADIRRSGR